MHIDGPLSVFATDLEDDGDADALAAASYLDDKIVWYENWTVGSPLVLVSDTLDNLSQAAEGAISHNVDVFAATFAASVAAFREDWPQAVQTGVTFLESFALLAGDAPCEADVSLVGMAHCASSLVDLSAFGFYGKSDSATATARLMQWMQQHQHDLERTDGWSSQRIQNELVNALWNEILCFHGCSGNSSDARRILDKHGLEND